MTHFYVLIKTPPWLGQLLPDHPQICRQNFWKPVKNHKIRYKSAITQKSVVKISLNFSKFPPHLLRSVCNLQVNCCIRRSCFTCCTSSWIGISALKRWFTCLFIIFRYIEVRIDLAVCFPTQFWIVILLQSSPWLNSYSFLSLGAYKVYMYRNRQQKCNLINFGPSQLFFGWVFLDHILEKVLDIYQYDFTTICNLFFTLSKKLDFWHFTSSNGNYRYFTLPSVISRLL
jgi:hypothetical protein